MENSTGLVAWGMNTDRLEKLKACAKEDVDYPGPGDDLDELQRVYKKARDDYRNHISMPFVSAIFVENSVLEPQAVGINRLIVFDDRIVDVHESSVASPTF